MTNKFDVGIVSARNARSYTIYMENCSHISRNGIDLKHTDAPFELRTQPVVSTYAKSKRVHVPPNPIKTTNAKCTGKANLIGKEIDVRKPNPNNSMYTMCSGHVSKPVARLITQM